MASTTSATAGTAAPSVVTNTVDCNTLANKFAKAVISGDQDKLKNFLPSADQGNQDKLSGLLDAATTIDNTKKFFEEVIKTPNGTRNLAKELEAQLEKDFPNTSSKAASSTYGHLHEIAKIDEQIKVYQQKLMNVEKELQDEGLLPITDPPTNASAKINNDTVTATVTDSSQSNAEETVTATVTDSSQSNAKETVTATVTDSSQSIAAGTANEEQGEEIVEVLPVYKSDNEDENKDMEDNETDPDKVQYADPEVVKLDPRWRASACSHAHDSAYLAALKVAQKHGKCKGVHDPENEDWLDPLEYEEEDMDPDLDYCMVCRVQDVDKSSPAGFLMQCYAKNPETNNKPMGCKGWVHPGCVRLQEAPKGDWVCYDCVMEHQDFFSNSAGRAVGPEGVSFRPHTIPGYKTSSDEGEQTGSDEERVSVRKKKPFRKKTSSSARKHLRSIAKAGAIRHKKNKMSRRHTKVPTGTSKKRIADTYSDDDDDYDFENDDYDFENDADSSAGKTTIRTNNKGPAKKKKRVELISVNSRKPAPPSVASKPAPTAFGDCKLIITEHTAKKTLKEDGKRNVQREENKTLPRGSGGNNAGTYPKSNTQCMDTFVRRQVIQLQLPVEQLQTMSTPPIYMDGYEVGTDPTMERAMQSWARNVWGVFHVGDQAPNKAGSSQVQFLPSTTMSMWCGSEANCQWVQDIIDGSKPLRFQLFNSHSGFMQTVELAAQKIKSEDDSDGEKKPAAKAVAAKKKPAVSAVAAKKKPAVPAKKGKIKKNKSS